MSMKIRLARGGSKKRPHYSIVAADSRYARDGRFVEKLGTYSPLLPKDNEDRVRMNLERVQYWLGHGAQPTDRVARFLENAGILAKKTRANMKKSQPGKAAQERAKEKADKAAPPPPAPRPTRRRPANDPAVTAPSVRFGTRLLGPAARSGPSCAGGPAFPECVFRFDMMAPVEVAASGLGSHTRGAVR